jgi:transcriptional regulator with XRE-family HTH domain
MKNQRSASPTDMHVGQRMRLRRLELDMSQEKMADSLGITFQQIQKYEKGTNRISAGRLLDLSRTLDVPVGYFFDGLEAPSGGADMPHGDTILSVLEDPATLRVVRSFARIHDQRVRSQAAGLIDAIVAAVTPVNPEASTAALEAAE